MRTGCCATARPAGTARRARTLRRTCARSVPCRFGCRSPRPAGLRFAGRSSSQRNRLKNSTGFARRPENRSSRTRETRPRAVCASWTRKSRRNADFLPSSIIWSDPATTRRRISGCSRIRCNGLLIWAFPRNARTGPAPRGRMFSTSLRSSGAGVSNFRM